MKINTFIEIPESEIHETFIHGSGPGGQNVNKVASAVQLRFDVRASEALPPELKTRLIKLSSNHINSAGVMLIKANRYRTQAQNRKDARERLADIIRRSLRPKRKRVRTNPSRRARQARIDDKKKRAKIKSYRRKIYPGGTD